MLATISLAKNIKTRRYIMEIIKEAIHNYDFTLCNCDNNNSTDSCPGGHDATWDQCAAN